MAVVSGNDRGAKGGKNSSGGSDGGCPIVAGSTTVTATTTRSAVAWGAGAAAAASRGTASVGGTGGNSGIGNGSRGNRGGTGHVGGAQDAFWYRPFKSLAGGEAGLKRQVEGGVSSLPPGARCRDKLSQDLNLSRPWTPTEAEKFSQALLEEGSKNFYAVQVGNRGFGTGVGISEEHEVFFLIFHPDGEGDVFVNMSEMWKGG